MARPATSGPAGAGSLGLYRANGECRERLTGRPVIVEEGCSRRRHPFFFGPFPARQGGVRWMDVLLHGAWRVAWRLGFALLGESLFPDAEKVTKNALPLHPALRFAPGAFTTPWLRGSPYKGHPWPFTALAASLRLAPLRDGSVHPPEGACGVAWWAVRAKKWTDLPWRLGVR